jgi:hypothetical protein
MRYLTCFVSVMFLTILSCSTPQQFTRLSSRDCEILAEKRIAKKHRQPKVQHQAFYGQRFRKEPSANLQSKNISAENDGIPGIEKYSDVTECNSMAHPEKANQDVAFKSGMAPIEDKIFPFESLKLPQDNFIQTETIIASNPSALAFTGVLTGALLVCALALTAFSGSFIRVSAWAAKNPQTTKGLIAGIYTITGLGAYGIGNVLAADGVNLQTEFIAGSAAATVLTALAYPKKNGSLQNFTRKYLRQKYCDMVLFAAATTMVVYTGNNVTGNLHYATAPSYATVNYQENKEDKVSSSLQKDDNTKQGKPRKRSGEKAAAIFLFVVLMLAVTVLSCSIACSGNGVLAIAVLGLGVTGTVLLLRRMLKNIRRKNERDLAPEPGN